MRVSYFRLFYVKTQKTAQNGEAMGAMGGPDPTFFQNRLM